MNLADQVRARLRRKRNAYQLTFFGEQRKPHVYAAIVLADLKKFCGINRGGIVVSPVLRITDPFASAYRAGQRDVFLRVAKMLELDETEITEVLDNDSSSSE